MNSPYVGVYSDVGAGTRVGTEVAKQVVPGVGNNLIVNDSKTKGRQYQVISKSTLEDADLNVAKIRLVTTLPGKEIPEEMRGKAYVGFILTGVQENHNEKVEVINLPGDTFASYFYGAAPRQFGFSGILLNTDQDQWRDSFEELYEKYLRGSVSSRNFSIVQVSYNGRVVSGWLTNLTQQLNSDNDHYASFSFSVLVSRIDMVGGSKKFSDYLVTLAHDGGDFKGANIDADYAVLDPSNFNGMIDPIRTGMVIPPKRPHKVRKKKVTQNCWFPAEKTESGKATNTGAATANNHINDATQCSVIEAIEGTNAKIQEALDEAKKLLQPGKDKDGKDKVPTQKDIQDAKDLEAKAKLLSNRIAEEMAKDSVKEQLADESAKLIQYYREVAAGQKEGSDPTKRARAQAALRSGKIKVGSATIKVDSIVVDGEDIFTDDAGYIAFDPEIDDGTEASARAREERGELFHEPDPKTGKFETLGLGDEALDARKKKDEADEKERKAKAAEASARGLAKRSGL